MTRYYEDWNRMAAHRNLLFHNNFVTCEQIKDICGLLREGRIPDGTYSDHECIVWEVIKEELGIKY